MSVARDGELLFRSQTDFATQRRFRVVYHDAVISFSLAAEATLAEVAQFLGRHLDRRYDDPILVDATLCPAATLDDRRHPE